MFKTIWVIFHCFFIRESFHGWMVTSGNLHLHLITQIRIKINPHQYLIEMDRVAFNFNQSSKDKRFYWRYSCERTNCQVWKTQDFKIVYKIWNYSLGWREGHTKKIKWVCLFVPGQRNISEVKRTFSIKTRKYRFLHKSKVCWGRYSSSGIIWLLSGS